ncbi:hypothetical protein LPB41_12650 [Thalassospira sp. MA62]|nr:hypothetical protein [Thalassospira sp. MA62]
MTPDQKNLLIKKIDSTLMQAMLGTQDIALLLKIAKQYGHFHWFNLTERWENKQVENHIFRIAFPHLKHIDASASRTKVTHILSEGHDTGGHTPLCINIIKEQKERGRDVELLITNGATTKVLEDVKQSGIPFKIFGGQGLPQLCALAEHIVHSKSIVMHINPDDIEATLAVMFATKNGASSFFVNHANIHFSYGTAQCSCMLEITAGSWLSSAKYRSPQKQSFLGIPATSLEQKSLNAVNVGSLKPEAPYFVSVGTRNKYRLNNSPQFIEFIDFLCGEKQQNLLLIGPGDAPQFQKLSKAARDKLTPLGLTERQTTLALVADATAYIDSFPESGGTSVMNAMSLGLPVFGQHISEGMYGDDFLSPSMEDLYTRITDFINNGYDQDILQKRTAFIRDHMSVQACVDRLEKALEGKQCPIPYDYNISAMDLDFHHRAWALTGDLIVPPMIKINNP